MASPVTRYHPLLVALHWLLAALIIADLTIGTVVLVHIPNDTPKKIEGLRAHMTGGLAILALMALRLGVRVRSDKPADAPTGSAILDRIAWLSHRLLYVAVFGMIASGLVMALQSHAFQVVFQHQGRLPASFWAFPVRGLHFAFAKLLMALIALHFAGALYHTFARRDRLLARMWFGRRRAQGAERPSGAALPQIFTRMILAPPSLLFSSIALKYLTAPVKVSAGSGALLTTPSAITDARVEGGLFIGLALVALYGLVTGRRLASLAVLAGVLATVTAARTMGLALDGASHETVLKLVPEVVLTALLTAAFLIERRRLRRLAGTVAQPSADVSGWTAATAAGR
jgi:cytochrome b561